MHIKENEPLKLHTTFRIGGKARYFFLVETTNEIRDAILFAEHKKIPFFVLGGGSNLLFQDEDYNGLIIKIGIKGLRFEVIDSSVRISASAGEVWDDVVSIAVNESLWGIENLSAIPGSVGAAAIQNIGAYGVEVKDSIESVEVFDTNLLTTYTIAKGDCQFAYRSSIFKKPEGKHWIVTGITLRLVRDGAPNFSYKDVTEYFKNHTGAPTLQEVRNAIIEIRGRKLPNVGEIGTAGSFFKNPILSGERFKELSGRFSDIPSIPMDGGMVKVPAGWLLDKIGGFKGATVGGAKVYEKQALVIVSDGTATAHDVRALSDMMQKKIFEETNIMLEPEVVVV